LRDIRISLNKSPTAFTILALSSSTCEDWYNI
jgi:hypothetical protein